jgi:hypothetical protein
MPVARLKRRKQRNPEPTRRAYAREYGIPLDELA